MTRNKVSTTPHPKIVTSSLVKPPTLGQTIKEGFGLGVGLSVGRNIVDGVFNMFSNTKPSNSSDINKVAEYEKCMKYTSNDVDTCKSILDSK